MTDDFEGTLAVFAAAGVRWSSVTRPVARLEAADGRVGEHPVSYAAAVGGEPRIKVISAASGSVFVPVVAGPGVLAVHHLSYWVADVEVATAALVGAGWVVEATGLDADDSVRYRYLVHPLAGRIELGLEANRAEFDAWADSPA
ncbi:VOC family protein [Herbiconiux sp. CPCC 203407]|uniref:VOC family protein n=1 Tax=Herbiconiux oxytropis TaxID=2970915 RepID=A0AA41XGZ9_9MICO|nr:VOC family protein [Herbiconiux oxytropis]MCS5722725.1 VOC family protein [Herbiconiux oxytropis]MCS5728022.1 VOC family protein [Herbiconiux oxytropis]